MQNMNRRFFHGKITPVDVAQSLLAEFNRSNLHAETFGASDKMFVQIATWPGAPSGGQTVSTVTIEDVPDGVMVQLGQHAWMGTAASLGWSALTALRNPFTLLGRIDDIAEDLENLQLPDNIWKSVERAAQAAGASHQLSERLTAWRVNIAARPPRWESRPAWPAALRWERHSPWPAEIADLWCCAEKPPARIAERQYNLHPSTAPHNERAAPLRISICLCPIGDNLNF